MNRVLKVVLTAMFFAFAAAAVTPAFAQGGFTLPGYEQEESNKKIEKAAAPLRGSFFDSLMNIGDKVKARVRSIQGVSLMEKGMGYAQTLVTPALALAGALALVYLSFEMVRAFSGGGNVPQTLVDIAIPAILTGLLIRNYPSLLGEFNEVLEIFRQAGGDPAGVIDKVVDFYTAVLKLIGKGLTDAFKNAGEQALNIVVGENSDFLLSLVDLLVTTLFCILIFALVLMGLAEITALILLGPFLFAVGIAFGPVFLAGMATPWTRDYVGRWVGFLVGAAVLTGVLSVIIGLSTAVFDALQMESVVAGGDYEIAAVQLAIAAMILIAVNNLISQAPSIASALVPGTIGASRTGGAGIGAGARSVASGPGHIARHAMGIKQAHGKQQAARAAAQAAARATTAAKAPWMHSI